MLTPPPPTSPATVGGRPRVISTDSEIVLTPPPPTSPARPPRRAREITESDLELTPPPATSPARGRPRKVTGDVLEPPKRGRGRPKRNC